MLHVRADEVSGRKGGDEGKFARHDGRCDDAGELLCVRTWCCWMGAADAEKVENGTLGGQDRSASDCPDFDRGHGDGHEKILSTVNSTRRRKIST
jgi:hypothetical protein